MGEPSRNTVVLFLVVIITLTIAPVGQCIGLELVSESSLPSGILENITWIVSGNHSGVDYDIHNSTELVKVNGTMGWSRNEMLPDKMVDAGKKVKGFFYNLTSGLFGSRKKRSTGVYENLYVDRSGKRWRSPFGDMYGYGRNGNMGFDRPYIDNIHWPAPYRWYNGPRVGNENTLGEINNFAKIKNGRYLQPNHELFPPMTPGYETFPHPKPLLRMRNRYLPRVQQTYDPMLDSVRIFKQMKSKLLVKKRKKTEVEKHGEMGQREVPEMMEVYTWNGPQPAPGSQSQYKCNAGTKGIMTYQDGRTISSRGLTYSEEDNRGMRTLLCKAVTSDVSQPDQDIFLKNSVIGLNIITNDNDPFKFLERGNEIDSETLEIGSLTGSELSYSSAKNQSMSSVSTQGKGAHSQTKVNTQFVYENGYRTAFDSKADVEGSTTFNATNAIPLMLTSRKEESSSILQNPDKHGVESVEKDGIATLMKYKKKVDFDIAFRHFFD